MRKRVVGIVGSPRQGGNTEILVDEVLTGALAAGGEIEKIRLTDYQIAPCRGCESCAQTGECIQEDDMRLLIQKMTASHVWVLGTPIYWWGPTAQFKIFMDRWFSAEDSMFQGQQIILVIPFGSSGGEGSKHIVGMFETSLGKKNIFARILAPGVYSLGEVKKHKDLLDKARRAGREVVQEEWSLPT